ncbi:MAG: hypothetical protein ABIR70_16295 [Bryobacteraceae bacterium]
MNRGLQVVRGLGAFFICGMLLQAAGPWSVWDHMHELEGRQLALAFRDGTCTQGHASWSGNEGVFYADQLRSEDGGIIPARQFKILKNDIVRISEWWTPPAVKDLLYSTRSSWSDVGEIAAVSREQVSVTTRQGKEFRGKPSAVTADSIQIDSTRIPEAEVQTVDYLRYKPLSASQEYLVHEQASLLDVRLWFNRWLIPLVRIRVFDAMAAEDNTPICPKK